LFEVEVYANETEFMGKIYAYLLYFNYVRKRWYRDNMSPADEIKQRFPDMDEGIKFATCKVLEAA